jgi:hypothetical protein
VSLQEVSLEVFVVQGAELVCFLKINRVARRKSIVGTDCSATITNRDVIEPAKNIAYP